MDWTTLKPNDLILVESNDSYFLKESHAPIDMGYNGKFTVVRLDKTGILCYSRETGYAFIDMVSEGTSPATGIQRQIPNIYLIDE